MQLTIKITPEITIKKISRVTPTVTPFTTTSRCLVDGKIVNVDTAPIDWAKVGRERRCNNIATAARNGRTTASNTS